jgi:hypothetical protein
VLDIEPLVASIETFTSATAAADRNRLLGRIRDQLERLLAADEQSRAELERALATGVKAEESKQAILTSRDDESAAAKNLIPRILLAALFDRYVSERGPGSTSASPENRQYRGGLCRGLRSPIEKRTSLLCC